MTAFQLAVTAFLLLGNGFFVGSEFAIISARRTKVEPLADAGSRRANIALKAMGQVPLMIAGAQLGIQVCSIGLGAIAEPAIASLIEPGFEAIHLPEPLLHPFAFVIALLLVTYGHTVIGEMVPKNIALAGPDRLVLWVGPMLLGFCIATKPVLNALTWVSEKLLRLVRIEPTAEVKTVYTAEELASLVTESRTEGLLDANDYGRISGALALTERTAGDFMSPWTSVQTVNSDISPASLETLSVQRDLSRFPVIDRETRTVLGFVHVKETLGIEGRRRRMRLPTDAIRPLPVVKPGSTLAEALLIMRRARTHLVLVSAEGRSLGVLTLDDVLAAVVGIRRTATLTR
jgi:CBS domain containing-hemolysin-like protein